MALPSLAPQITPAGIAGPSFAQILAQLQQFYAAIYGADAQLTPNTQDGQFIAIMAQAIYDTGQTCIGIYNSISPSNAQGDALSRFVKINGLARKAPSFSTVVVTIVGQSGATINGGIVGDNQSLGSQWALPVTVVIPPSGTIDVPAISVAPGAVTASPGTLTRIVTPTLGWQTATNAAAATPGLAAESDAALRVRQTQSTSLPALTPLQAILAAVQAVPGVGRTAIFENDTNNADASGRPPHSITLVVEGGDPTAIATAIANKKSPGTSTFGTTSVQVVDPSGAPNTINFFTLQQVTIDVTVTLKALAGFTPQTGPIIQTAVAAFLTQLGIGTESYLFRLLAPANLSGDVVTAATGISQAQLDTFANTFTVTAITQGLHGETQSAADLPIAFNQAAFCAAANVAIVVT